ncbi:MAG: GH3 auxin-responsive promoter family protein, partial [Bacteroidales bacterium]
NNYTVAPVFMTGNKKGYHQWLVEFENEPENIESFRHTLDNAIRSTNSDYDAKRTNDTTMTELQIVTIKKGVFYKWFFIKGKLGGQNKVPRLSNDRKYATELLELNHMDNADHTI